MTMIRRNWLLFTLAAGIALPAAPAALAADKDKKSDKPIVAVFRLDGAVTEEPNADDLGFGGDKSVSLKELVERLNKAAGDDSVKAVVLAVEGGAIGTAQREEIRQAMAKVRAGGKAIYAHADSLHMGEYALLAGATRLSVVPTGDLWVTGLHGETPYLRGLLDFLGVQPEFLTCGAYKSAAELFMRREPSPEAEKMQNWLLDGIFDTYVKLIATGRKVEASKVKDWIDNGPYSAEKARAAGMIDAVEHREAFERFIKENCGNDVVFERKYGEKKAPELDFNNPFAVFKLFGDMMAESKKKKSDKPAVGVVYVNGAIQLGKKQISPFSPGGDGAFSTDVRKALDEAARDDSVKAVVLRIDSPGGSAVASEIILAATKRVKAKKPFIVSMGDVAGSGGYYVACGADTIYADSATITGSIGVVSGKFVTNPMWAKVGITFKSYNRGAHADMLGSDRPFTKEGRELMQNYMDEIYGVFKGHVTAIRGDRLKKPIDDLAGGRVYTGKQALELGLVDKLGTMGDAIHNVAKQAKLTEYDVRVVPEPKNFLEQLMESTGGGKADKNHLDATVALPAMKLAGPSLLDLAAPHLAGMDPVRVQAVKRALLQLQLLNREGVSLMMPEIMVR
jgi:protease-4